MKIQELIFILIVCCLIVFIVGLISVIAAELEEFYQGSMTLVVITFIFLIFFLLMLFSSAIQPNIFFANPANNYTEEISSFDWLWVLFFGPLYLLFKGAIRHFVLFVFLLIITAGIAWINYPSYVKICIITMGITWIVYASLVRNIVINHYRRQGWVEIENH